MISEKIVKNDDGAMRTDNHSIDGYFIVEQTSNVYKQQDDTQMKGYIPLEYAYTDEIVCGASFGIL